MSRLSLEETVDDLIVAEGAELIENAPRSCALMIGDDRVVCISGGLPDDIRTVAKAHELGHLTTGSLYSCGENDSRVIGKCEETAFRYSAALLLPHSRLCAAIKKERTFDPCALSDVLSLPAEFVARCEVLWFGLKNMEVPRLEN